MKIDHPIFTIDFILVFLAQLAFNSVLQLLIPTLPIYLKKLGSSEIEIGLLIGTISLASIISRPLAGKALVKAKEKTFMLVGSALYAITSLVYLIVPLFWPFMLARVFHGIGSGLFHTASTVYVVNISEPETRARVLGYFALTVYIAGAIAPPLGIIFLDTFGPVYLFLVCAVVSLGMMFISGRLRESKRAGSNNPNTEDSVWLSTVALPPSIIGFFILFIWTSVTTFFPLYARSLGMVNPGLFFTATAVMLILGRTLGGKIMDLPDKRLVILTCIFIFIVALGMLSLSKKQSMFLIAAALWGAGNAFALPSLINLALEYGGPSSAPVVATFYTVSDIGMFLGPIIMGTVVHYTGYPFMFFCLSLMGVISFIYFWYFTKKS